MTDVAEEVYGDRIDYEGIERNLLFGVKRWTQNLMLLDNSGCVPWSPTGLIDPGAITKIYAVVTAVTSGVVLARPSGTTTAVGDFDSQMKVIFYGTTKDSLEVQFNKLAEEWKRETRHISNSEDMVSHPAYSKIIAMGEPVVPFILADMERDPDNFWFSALRQITGQDPIAPYQSGNLRRLSKAWIAWGKKHGKR